MAQLQITQTGSAIGGKRNQRETLRTLGLGKIGRTAVQADSPSVRGMIQVVSHLVKVEEVD